MSNDLTSQTGPNKVSLGGLMERMKSLEKRMDEGFDRVVGDVDEIKKDHEDRLRSLERAHWKALGIAAAVSFLIAGGASLVTILAFVWKG